MDGIDKLFATHVVELVAVRRNPKMGKNPIRAFFATNNYPLLNSIPGKVTLHFRAPTHPPPYNAKAKNLKTVWDILMQDWRNVNLNSYAIREVLPIRNQEEISMFWGFFSAALKPMTTNEKIAFMDNRGYRTFTLDGVKKYMEEMRNEQMLQNQEEIPRLVT